MAGSRCSNWNNYVWNSNWNIGARAACEDNSLVVALICSQGSNGATNNMVRLSILLWRTHYWVCKIVSSEISKAKDNATKGKELGKKYRNLMEKIVDTDNLRNAYFKTVKGGNRFTIGHLHFKEHLETNLYLLQKQITENLYKIGSYKQFKVYEPKERVIQALPFRDRVVQHAIFNTIEPIFEKVFYSQSYACRKSRGTHKGVKDVQATIRRLSKNGQVFYLKMDFSKYFHSIDVDILFTEIERKIRDEKLLKLLKQFTNKNKGIPIGNLLSQLFANIYGHIFDRFIKTKLHIKHYFRYMDDTVILSNESKELRRYQKILQKFSAIFMKLKFSKWHISSLSKPLNFLGYRITATYKLIRKDSGVRAKRKIKRYTKHRQNQKLSMFLASWFGHIQHSDSYNLIKSIKKELCYARDYENTFSNIATKYY